MKIANSSQTHGRTACIFCISHRFAIEVCIRYCSVRCILELLQHNMLVSPGKCSCDSACDSTWWFRSNCICSTHVCMYLNNMIIGAITPLNGAKTISQQNMVSECRMYLFDVEVTPFPICRMYFFVVQITQWSGEMDCVLLDTQSPISSLNPLKYEFWCRRSWG